jgi:hypothetical protein
MRQNPVSVVVWRSYHCRTDYSVSICGEDGSEITCVGGSDDVDEAYTLACETADGLGIPAREVYESGEVKRSYTPTPDDTATAED